MLIFLEVLIVTCCGLLLGSFSSALTYRAPLKINWVSKRSICTSCKKKLSVFDLVPVFSWLFTRGKCRYCSKPVSVKYPLIECASVILSLEAYLLLGFGGELFFLLAALPFLIALFLIDVEHMILPNALVFSLMLIGLVRLFYVTLRDVFIDVQPFFVEYFVGAAVFAFVSWSLGFVLTKVLKKDSLGFGDVKFFFVSGLWLGLYMLPYFMILSGSIAILIGVFWRFKLKNRVFPFGPALILSLYGLLLFEGSILL